MKWSALFFLLAACSAGPGRGIKPTPAPPSCSTAPVGLDGLLSPGRILLFGEIHGTREIPAFVGEALCHAARRGPTRLGLEIPATEQASIEAYLASAGLPADRAALMASPFWQRDFQDGRSSMAMMELIERARSLRAAGLPVSVLAFDAVPNDKALDRDAEMARRILEARAAEPGGRVLVLTGNVHARTTRGAPWNAAFEPMGLHLARAAQDTLALDAGYAPGTAWVCLSGKAAECGAKRVGGQGGHGAGRAQTIERIPAPSPEGFHGWYHVGTISASPPAQPALKPLSQKEYKSLES